MKYLYALILSLALIGCASGPELTNTQIVEVPIITKCEPTMKITEITFHPRQHLTTEMPLFDQFQLVLAELQIIEGQNKELTAALAECTK